MEWLNDNEGGVLAILTGVLVLLTGFYAITTLLLVRSAENTRRDAALPVVAFQLAGDLRRLDGPDNIYEIGVEAVNVGPSPALATGYIWIPAVTSSIVNPSEAVGIGSGDSTMIHLTVRPTPSEFLNAVATEMQGEHSLWTAGVLLVNYRDAHRRPFRSAVSVDIGMRGEKPRLAAFLAEPAFAPGTGETVQREGKLLRFADDGQG